MKSYRQTTTTLLILASTLAASGCSREPPATAAPDARPASADSAAAATSSAPDKEFNGKVTDFVCPPNSKCDHLHYSVGDAITVSPVDVGKTYRFRSETQAGVVNETELTYDNRLMRGTVRFDHHGQSEEHYLILEPTDAKWKIVTCKENPFEAESCEGDQHAGYGHADD